MVLHPTIEEARANWDKVAEWDRKNIEAAEAFRAAFERRKLRRLSELPDIPEPSFTRSWDFADKRSHRETLIRHGGNVIFAEPASTKVTNDSSKWPRFCAGVMAQRCAT
jgi:hypothetical protein